jgi:hypothetical protein
MKKNKRVGTQIRHSSRFSVQVRRPRNGSDNAERRRACDERLMIGDQSPHDRRDCFAVRGSLAPQAIEFRPREPDVQLVFALASRSGRTFRSAHGNVKDGGGVYVLAVE